MAAILPIITTNRDEKYELYDISSPADLCLQDCSLENKYVRKVFCATTSSPQIFLKSSVHVVDEHFQRDYKNQRFKLPFSACSTFVIANLEVYLAPHR